MRILLANRYRFAGSLIPSMEHIPLRAELVRRLSADGLYPSHNSYRPTTPPCAAAPLRGGCGRSCRFRVRRNDSRRPDAIMIPQRPPQCNPRFHFSSGPQPAHAKPKEGKRPRRQSRRGLCDSYASKSSAGRACPAESLDNPLSQRRCAGGPDCLLRSGFRHANVIDEDQTGAVRSRIVPVAHADEQLLDPA